MRVLLIGAGRYGNRLVGKKYTSGELGAKLVGVIDPKIDEIKRSVNYYMEGIPTYHSLDELPYKSTKDVVADIALIPQIVPQVFGQISNLGVKKVILPKPVATNFEDYQKICSIAEENNMQAVVASNWHYSDITQKLKSFVKEITTNTGKPLDKKVEQQLKETEYGINSIDVEYSKKNEVLDIDPPLQELPHALQILLSSGLVKKLDEVTTTMENQLQSKSRVNLKMTDVRGIKEGISINSDLRSGDKLKANRKRSVEIHLDNTDTTSTITADYDAVFDSDGTCKKYPKIVYEYQEGGTTKTISYIIKEDNINKMYREIFRTLNGESNNSLTITDYKPLAEYMSKVEENWLEKQSF